MSLLPSRPSLLALAGMLGALLVLLLLPCNNSKFTYRGVDLDQLLDMKSDELVELFHARARRRCGGKVVGGAGAYVYLCSV